MFPRGIVKTNIINYYYHDIILFFVPIPIHSYFEFYGIYNGHIAWNEFRLNRNFNCQCISASCCSRELLEVHVNDLYCIWSSIMQKLKNILGSRKKGAQEPHAAREPRNDYQGYTTSNLKGISLERLTLPVGITSYCICPLFSLLFPSTI